MNYIDLLYTSMVKFGTAGLTAIAIILAVLAILAASLFWFLPWLAEENVLVTKVPEGTFKAIMRGNSFDHFVLSFRGHHLNAPGRPWFKPEIPDWQVVSHMRGNTFGFDDPHDSPYDDRSWLMRYLGLYWVGWPWNASVFVYQFEWNETFTDQSSGKEKILPRAEATEIGFASDFTYAIVTDAAETKDRLATDELTLVTVAIRNPYRALFTGEEWMRRVSAAINRHVREYVGERDFAVLVTKSDKDAFSKPIIGLTHELPDDKPDAPEHHKGLFGRYGIEIRTADLQTIELAGEAKARHEEATTRKYVAEQEAAAILAEGEAQANVIKMRGAREAEALAKRLKTIEKYGRAGIALAGLDAVRDSAKEGNTIIWANNPLEALKDAAKALKGDET